MEPLVITNSQNRWYGRDIGLQRFLSSIDTQPNFFGIGISDATNFWGKVFGVNTTVDNTIQIMATLSQGGVANILWVEQVIMETS